MTDKEQIIIDGVNVGGCKYLNTFSDCDGYHYYCDLADDIKNEYCEYYKDCYFKQLARKTQECEELKVYAQRQENQREEYYKEYLKLSQEYKELKERLERVEEDLKYDCVNCMNIRSNKYYEALADIEKAFEYDIEYGSGLHKQILDIISKAKEGNE